MKDYDKDSIEAICRRSGKEYIKNKIVFCGADEECLYRAEESDSKGRYRCMSIDKMGAWRYDRGC